MKETCVCVCARLFNWLFSCNVCPTGFAWADHAMASVWLNQTSWLAFLVCACSAVMTVPRYQPKLVYRSARKNRTGRRKLATWSEYWLRVLPASSALVKHGKPNGYVWTDLAFSKRTSLTPPRISLRFSSRLGGAWSEEGDHAGEAVRVRYQCHFVPCLMHILYPFPGFWLCGHSSTSCGRWWFPPCVFLASPHAFPTVR